LCLLLIQLQSVIIHDYERGVCYQIDSSLIRWYYLFNTLYERALFSSAVDSVDGELVK